MTLEAQEIRSATNKWDLTQLKSYYTAKETMRQRAAHKMGDYLSQLYISEN